MAKPRLRKVRPTWEGDIANRRIMDLEPLISSGRLDEIAALLRGLADAPDRDDELSNSLWQLLARGRMERVREALGEDDLAPSLEVFSLDAANRVAATTADHLQSVLNRFTESQAPRDLLFWLRAVNAEYYLWRVEITGMANVPGILADLAGVEPTVWTILASGRLKRLLAVAVHLAGDAESGKSMFVEAETELGSIDVVEEVLITRALRACVNAFTRGSLAVDEIDELKSIVLELDAIGSDRLAVGWAGLAWASAMTWNLDTLDEAIVALDRLPQEMIWPMLAQIIGLVHVVAELYRLGPLPRILDALNNVIEDLQILFAGAPIAMTFLAGVLLDAGSWEPAANLAIPASSTEMAGTPMTRLYVAEIKARILLYRNRDRPSLDRALRVAKDWEELGFARVAAVYALRVGWDCQRVGLTADAQAFRSYGLDRLPPPGDRTQWESHVAANSSPSGGGELRLFGPELVVIRNAQPVDLPPVLRKIVVLLALAHGSVDTDWLIEAVWPNQQTSVGRDRLKANMYRLRKMLSIEPGELVVRDELGIELRCDGGWNIDVWDFLELAGGDKHAKAEAYEMYTANPCGRELRYDDEVERQRLELRHRWIPLAFDLLRHNEISAHQISERASILGTLDPTFVYDVAGRLSRLGHEKAANELLAAAGS